ncbi:MAG: ATP-dependent DNA helicase [Candidatus Aenigmatarchaeota archaeon]
MLFPFEHVREGQRELIKDVEVCLRERKNLIANAPSGVGKTVATIAPSLEYALENGKTIFFLTPKHSQHRIVIETLQKIKQRFKVDFRAVDIIGKKWLCPISGVEMLSTHDFMDYCTSIKKNERCIFYNNTRQKGELTEKARSVLNKILFEKPLHAEEIKMECRGLCPYEIMLEFAKYCNVIVCDYYHIFSFIREHILNRIGKRLEDTILIVDEAHNLPDRIRNLLSGKISLYTLRQAQHEATIFGFHEIKDNLNKVEEILKNLAKGNKEEFFVEKNDFIKEIELIKDYNELIEDLELAAIEVRGERKRSFIGSISHFLDLWLGEDLGYARILKKEKDKISLNYICLDPLILAKDIQDAHCIILMSGTLNPPAMYKDLLGFGDNTICNKYKSCFPPKNRLNLVIQDVTTQYKKRTKENFEKIAEYIIRISEVVNGNMAAFFPSYDFRDQIYYLIRDNIKKELCLERQDSNKEEKMKLFKEFVSSKNKLLLGPQSGSFAEGMDFFGGVLKCVIVVGISLSKPDLATKALINYYNYRFKKGREYGYIYPAVHRALQSAGRCIRTESDKAVVVFMDNRFLWKNYRLAFPADLEFKVTTEPEKYIKDFFS